MLQNMRMRRALLCLMVVVFINTKTDQSHTFFVPRQVTTNPVFELGLNNYSWYYDRNSGNEYFYGIYATPFFQQSTKSKDIARYFFPGNASCLTFNEINQDSNAIESLWFGIMSDLNSNLTGTFSMLPRHRSYGAYINGYFAKSLSCGGTLWFNVALAAMGAEHTLNMCEQIGESDGPLSNFTLGTLNEFTSIITALNNPEWDFGKFCCSKLKRSGVDDIQLKLGYDYYWHKNEVNHISPYLVGTIPTGKRQHSHYIFEPLVGSKNGSLGLGVNADYRLYSSCSSSLTWLFDFKYRYVFGANQCRSFDLCKNGDWSRYLLMVPSDQRLDTTQAINKLTLNTKVIPGSTIDIWTALNWQLSDFNIEVGYSFWWRQKEKIRLKNCIDSGFGIFDLAGAANVPQSASCATIHQGPLAPNQAKSDSSFVATSTRDLDLDSAAHPTALSSTIYVAGNWQPEIKHNPIIVGLGGQYEFAHRISALNKWALWAKLGITF